MSCVCGQLLSSELALGGHVPECRPLVSPGQASVSKCHAARQDARGGTRRPTPYSAACAPATKVNSPSCATAASSPSRTCRSLDTNHPVRAATKYPCPLYPFHVPVELTSESPNAMNIAANTTPRNTPSRGVARVHERSRPVVSYMFVALASALNIAALSCRIEYQSRSVNTQSLHARLTWPHGVPGTVVAADDRPGG